MCAAPRASARVARARAHAQSAPPTQNRAPPSHPPSPPPPRPPPPPQADLSTFANNLVGVVLGGLQLGLIWAYPSKRQVTNVAEKKHEPSSPTSAGAAGSGAVASPAPGASGAGASGGGSQDGGDADVSESAPLAR